MQSGRYLTHLLCQLQIHDLYSRCTRHQLAFAAWSCKSFLCKLQVYSLQGKCVMRQAMQTAGASCTCPESHEFTTYRAGACSTRLCRTMGNWHMNSWLVGKVQKAPTTLQSLAPQALERKLVPFLSCKSQTHSVHCRGAEESCCCFPNITEGRRGAISFEGGAFVHWPASVEALEPGGTPGPTWLPGISSVNRTLLDIF